MKHFFQMMQYLLVLNFGNVCLRKGCENIAKLLKDAERKKQIRNTVLIEKDFSSTINTKSYNILQPAAM